MSRNCRRRNYGLIRFSWDCFLTVITFGIWPCYLLLKFLRRNS